jgi:hypothetical protein
MSVNALFAVENTNKTGGIKGAKRLHEEQMGLVRHRIWRPKLGEFKLMWAASFLPKAMLLIFSSDSKIVSSVSAVTSLRNWKECLCLSGN